MPYRPIAETYPFIEVTFGNEMLGCIHVDRIDTVGQSSTGHARIVSNGYPIDLNDRFTDFEPRLREAIEHAKRLNGPMPENDLHPTQTPQKTSGKR